MGGCAYVPPPPAPGAPGACVTTTATAHPGVARIARGGGGARRADECSDPERARVLMSQAARQQKMRSDGNSFPPGRKVLTEGFKEAAAGDPE